MAETRYTVFPDLEDDEEFVEESGELIPSEENESFHYDPVVTTPAYHIEQGEKALEKLKSIVNESGWKKALTVKNTTVYTKNGSGGNEKAPIFMCQHIIERFSPQSIFAVIGMRKLWDPWYEEGNLIDNLNESTSLTYMVMQGVAGTRIRDLSLVEKIQCAQDGTIYFAATSVEKVPHVVDRIRAYLYLNGWIIKPISYNPLRTKVTYVLQTKVNGWVPSVVAKKYLTRRPLVVHIIDQYLQKNGPPPMVISASPPDSNPQSRNGSNASFFPPRNQIDGTDQQRNKFKREITFKETQGKPSLDSPSIQNHRREITFSDSTQPLKKEIVRKMSLDLPSIQTNRPFYSNNNNTIHALSFKKEINRKPSFDSLKIQNIKKETFLHTDNDNDLSSQSSQVTLDELRPLPKLSTASLTSPSSPTLPSLLTLPPLPNSSTSSTSPASPVSPTFPISPTLPVLPTLPPTTSTSPTSPRRFQFPLPPDHETVPIQTQPTSPFQSKPYVPPPPSSPPLSLPPPPPPPPPQIKHPYDDAVNAAVTTFKDNIKTLEGWDLYSESKGVKIYTKDVANRSNPIIRGDYTLIGKFTADDFLSVIKNLDIRKFWDDRYEDGENVKLYDNDNILSKVSLKGTFPISGRDFVLCGKVERDQETSTIHFVTTSVTDPAIPEIKKYVRGHIHFAGWKIIPKFDANGNTKALGIIYVVDTDIKLDSVPSAILKSISTGTPMVIQKIDEMMKKIGFPPYVMNSSSLVVSENLHPKNFQYNLTFVAENNEFTDIRFSKKMYSNGFDINIVPNNVKVELLPDDQEIVRIIHPSDVSKNKIQIRITKYTEGYKTTYNEKDRIPLAQKKVDPRPEVSKSIPITANYSSMKSAQSISQFETVQKSQNQRYSRHSRNFSQPINLNSTPVTNGIVDADMFDEQNSFALHRQQRHSRNLSHPIDLNTTNRDNTNNEQDSLTSLNQKNQRHSRKFSQSLDPNATLVSNEIVDKVQQDRTSKRKSKRLSFADSPSIINPSSFYEKEENIISEVISKIGNNNNNKNNYSADIGNVSDESENLEEYEEIMKTFNETPIEQHQMFDFNEDIFVITDNVKFNAYQATIMFIGMILSYYSGRLSCYFI